jgi:hypothetical protein
MKVNAPIPLFSTIDRVRGSESSGDAPKREKGNQDRPKKDESKDGSESGSYANAAELAAAADAFTHESSAASNGLQAEVDGQGPGLRVTLKDGRGAVVRQFTGEEFLRLREAAAGNRGRLLDKKL